LHLQHGVSIEKWQYAARAPQPPGSDANTNNADADTVVHRSLLARARVAGGLADHAAFRPLARAFAVDPGGEATNVNALDAVADSSWFTNRIGQRALSADDVASGLR
jgi:hypothetical protein